MRRTTLGLLAALVLTVGLTGCAGMMENGGVGGPEPEGHSRVRTGLVEIMRKDKDQTDYTTIGYGTTTDTPGIELWLMSSGEGPPWNLAVDDQITFKQLGPAVTKAQLCAKVGLTDPVLYEINWSVLGLDECP